MQNPPENILGLPLDKAQKILNEHDQKLKKVIITGKDQNNVNLDDIEISNIEDYRVVKVESISPGEIVLTTVMK